MSKKTVLILGSSGMLGSNCLRFLSQKDDLKILAQYRKPEHKTYIESFKDVIPVLDGSEYTEDSPPYIINCIGRIKPAIDKETAASVLETYLVNTVLPHHLAVSFPDSKIISIQTDCVFRGDMAGGYTEDTHHDDETVYGRSKSNGESKAENVFNIRASIIGQEVFRKWSLVEWVLNQPQNAVINGFTRHDWNGISCWAFAKICYAFIAGRLTLYNSQHLLPANVLTKFELVSYIAKAFGRQDIKVEEKVTPILNRTLATNYPVHNLNMWRAAGYDKVPSIQELIDEMAANKI